MDTKFLPWLAPTPVLAAGGSKPEIASGGLCRPSGVQIVPERHAGLPVFCDPLVVCSIIY